ncbi:hypothetical protein [Nostoc sp.]|uniref:hypothetical protein n=1 Tax=Nostoc sp. TaxID=1180 RepID=UPI002FFB458F
MTRENKTHKGQVLMTEQEFQAAQDRSQSVSSYLRWTVLFALSNDPLATQKKP